VSYRAASSHMKTLTYTVHASREQAERWEAAAAVQGRMAIGAWLAATADAYLRELAKAGRPRPLAWYRGRFVATLLDKDRSMLAIAQSSPTSSPRAAQSGQVVT
jgi:hypothetical protein